MVWISVILIWINILISIYKKKKITINKKDAISIVTYFFIAILITIIVRNGIFTGLQQLFAYPTICAFIIFEVKGNQKMFLNCMNNIMLILFILNPIMTKAFFELGSHLTFLGHVQLISQLGLLATFSSILYYILFKEKKIKTYCIIFFIEINLLTTDATAAILTAVLLIICFIIYKINFKNILLLNSKIYIFIGIIFNIFVITISVLNNVLNNINNVDMKVVDANGNEVLDANVTGNAATSDEDYKYVSITVDTSNVTSSLENATLRIGITNGTEYYVLSVPLIVPSNETTSPIENQTQMDTSTDSQETEEETQINESTGSQESDTEDMNDDSNEEMQQ